MATRYTAQGNTVVRTIAGGTVEMSVPTIHGDVTIALTTAQAHALMDQLDGNVPARIVRPAHPVSVGSTAGDW